MPTGLLANPGTRAVPDQINVLAIDDHPMIREGIAAVIDGEIDMEMVAQGSSGEEALELYRLHRPDVVIMDVQMPGMGGISAMEEIRREFPEARVIFLTISSGDVQAQRAIRAGASSYLLKSMVPKELRRVIRLVHAGQRYIPPEVAGGLASSLSQDLLSSVEVDVLKLVATGCSNKRIASALSVSEEAVKSRMKQILAKLSASDRTHAVTLAVRRGIIEL
jgi:DNA-binding NarL/FixJ family response regulator